jgi:hypothetical protein
MTGFVTSDFGECAALRLHGIEPFDYIVDRGQVTFHYAPDPDIEQVIREYRTGPMRMFDTEVRRVARWARDIKTARSSSNIVPYPGEGGRQ